MKDAYKSFEQNCTDLAVAERVLGLLQDENVALRTRMEALEGQHEMLSDNFDELHCGLVMLGGFTNLTSLTPAQRQHMYTWKWCW